VPDLLALVDHPKPTVARDVAWRLSDYVWSIVHGRTPPDSRIEVLSARPYFREHFARLAARPET
jgi:hypothetical protein